MSTAKIKLTVDGYHCFRCGHEWQPKSKNKIPRTCPKCKSAWFDEPGENKK